MQTTAVYSCVRILAEAVASLPIHVYRYTETGKERVYDHPLYYLLHIDKYVYGIRVYEDHFEWLMNLNPDARGELDDAGSPVYFFIGNSDICRV